MSDHLSAAQIRALAYLRECGKIAMRSGPRHGFARSTFDALERRGLVVAEHHRGSHPLDSFTVFRIAA